MIACQADPSLLLRSWHGRSIGHVDKALTNMSVLSPRHDCYCYTDRLSVDQEGGSWIKKVDQNSCHEGGSWIKSSGLKHVDQFQQVALTSSIPFFFMAPKCAGGTIANLDPPRGGGRPGDVRWYHALGPGAFMVSYPYPAPRGLG